MIFQTRLPRTFGFDLSEVEARHTSDVPVELLRRAAAARAGGRQISPQTIAHYRIVGKLGVGGMGDVWRATDTKLNREDGCKPVISGRGNWATLAAVPAQDQYLFEIWKPGDSLTAFYVKIQHGNPCGIAHCEPVGGRPMLIKGWSLKACNTLSSCPRRILTIDRARCAT
jgi:hypothetical protein